MMYGSWDIKCKGQSFLSFWAIFALWLSQQPKKSKFWKNKKTPGDIIILHLCTTNDNHMMYGFWDIKHNRQNFLSFWTIFYPIYYLPNNPENQNFENMKKTPGGIIILNRCTINENRMMYDSWDMEHDRQNLFSFWSIFCPFTPPLTPYNPENQNFEKIKKPPGDIIILHKCTINDNHIWYMVPELWSKVHQMKFFVILGHFLLFYPPNSLKNKNFKKNENKKLWEIIILHNCTQNHDHMLCCSWHMAHDKCNCYFSFWAFF